LRFYPDYPSNKPRLVLLAERRVAAFFTIGGDEGMAQRRMLSRRISQSGKVNQLSMKAQIIWTWTLPWLDDYGCYTGDADDIKSEVFPRNPKISKKDIESALLEESAIGLIILYKTNDRICQQYQNFEKSGDGTVFQTFKSDRERESSYPQYQQRFEIIGKLGIPMDSNGRLNISEVKLSKVEVNKNSFVEDSDEFRLASLLFSLIQERKPDHKKPNLQSWAKHIHLMLNGDKRTPQNIEAVIRWCQADAGDGGKWKGWQNNILSTAKLREKFDTLELRMKEQKNGRQNTNQRPAISEQDFGAGGVKVHHV
jgi:hypothetical protein